MEKLNKEYMKDFHNYIVAMIYYENSLNLNRDEISIDDYIEIEKKYRS